MALNEKLSSFRHIARRKWLDFRSKWKRMPLKVTMLVIVAMLLLCLSLTLVKHSSFLHSKDFVTFVKDSRSLRIAVVSTYAKKCGIATYSGHLREAMIVQAKKDGLNMTIDIVQMVDKRTLPLHPHVKIQVVKSNMSDYVNAGKYVSENYEYVMVHHEFGIFGGPYGEFLSIFLDNIKKDVRVQLILHSTEPESLIEREILMQRIVDATDDLIGLSESSCSVAGKWTRKKCHVVPHGAVKMLRAKTINEIRKFKLEAKRRIGFQENDFLMMSAGILRPGKGIDTAIRALPIIKEEFGNSYYVVVGRDQEDAIDIHQGYSQTLKNLAFELGVEENFITIDKYIGDEDLNMHLQAADVYVAPYQYLGQASSGMLPLAMSAGAIIIASPFLHAGELLQYERGLITPATSEDYIAMEVIHLMRDEELRSRITVNAVKYAETFSWPVVSKKHIDILMAPKDEKSPKIRLPRNINVFSNLHWVWSGEKLICAFQRKHAMISLGLKSDGCMLARQNYKISGSFVNIIVEDYANPEKGKIGFGHRILTRIKSMELHGDDLGITVTEEIYYNEIKGLIPPKKAVGIKLMHLVHVFRIHDSRNFKLNTTVEVFRSGYIVPAIENVVVGLEYLSQSRESWILERNYVKTLRKGYGDTIDRIMIKTTRTSAEPDMITWIPGNAAARSGVETVKTSSGKRKVNYVHIDFPGGHSSEVNVVNTFELRRMANVAMSNQEEIAHMQSIAKKPVIESQELFYT